MPRLPLCVDVVAGARYSAIVVNCIGRNGSISRITASDAKFRSTDGATCSIIDKFDLIEATHRVSLDIRTPPYPRIFLNSREADRVIAINAPPASPRFTTSRYRPAIMKNCKIKL